MTHDVFVYDQTEIKSMAEHFYVRFDSRKLITTIELKIS